MDNMRFPKREIVEGIKKEYPEGCRIILESMDDPYVKIPIGTKGTVSSVDDVGTIHVHWDTGHHLGIVYGEDTCRKLHMVEIICYGKRDKWDSREEAEAFFLKGIASSEGSERSRYTAIYTKLKMGMDVCSDDA
ncbi:uncharacterized protein DUF4314 [Kineothrix alysoides]|uniref:Uncharacterized protein DUF4314 n=1 Tax=Kineothrix alysoides TaxID=1469948 RepID=A0A4R1R4X9_9FIRM|nr:DUF4314 domain-containing protein [Kineothrix alysoides]TCL60565.1 uncharacterized protein DUF4314 [Kineothrix alysoides]